jgi:hypothetical protein
MLTASGQRRAAGNPAGTMAIKANTEGMETLPS